MLCLYGRIIMLVLLLLNRPAVQVAVARRPFQAVRVAVHLFQVLQAVVVHLFQVLQAVVVHQVSVQVAAVARHQVSVQAYPVVVPAQVQV